MLSATLSMLPAATAGQAALFGTILCLAVGLVAHLIWIWQSTRYPTGPQPWPLLGNMLYFSKVFKNPDLELIPLARKWGGLCMLWLGSQPVIIINRLEDAKEIFEKKSANFSTKPKRNVFHQRVWPGLIATQALGKEYGQMRRVYKEVLGPSQARSVRKYQDYESKLLLRDLYNSQARFMDHTRRYTISVIFSAVYGVRIGTLEHPAIRELFSLWRQMLDYFQPGSLLIDYLPFLQKLPESMQPWIQLADSFRARETKIHRAFLKKLQEEVAAGSQLKCFGADLVKIQEPFLIDDERAIDLLQALIIGGSDTVSSMSMSFFKVMALNPAAQKEAQDELDKVVGPSRLPTWEDEVNLPYLRALIKEVHRWAPIFTLGLPHASSAEDLYKGRTIPEGTIVFPNLNALQRDPERYDDPDSFKPERYLGDDLGAFASAQQPNYRNRDHAHYGFGRRLCQGIHVAESSLYISISRILWAFDITPIAGEPPLDLIDRTTGITTMPEPFKVSIQPRSDAAVRVLQESARVAQTDNLEIDDIDFGI